MDIQPISFDSLLSTLPFDKKYRSVTDNMMTKSAGKLLARIPGFTLFG